MAAYYWVDWNAERMVPPTAVHGGIDKDGCDIYVGRAYHEGDWLPAKVIPGRHTAYVAHGGGEHVKDTFQILCEQRFDWVPSSGGNIPPGAVEGGRTETGEPLYVGRVWYDGAHTVGKVHSSHGCCYIPYDSQEMSFPDISTSLKYVAVPEIIDKNKTLQLIILHLCCWIYPKI